MIATDDNVNLAEDSAVTFDVRSNDRFSVMAVSGINGSALNIASPVAVTGGQVRLNADGQLTFTPVANFNGNTSFSYQLGAGLSYQLFDGAFSTVTALPTSGGIQGFASDFNVGALAQSLTG